MDLHDIQNLKQHDRVKFVGDPANYVFFDGSSIPTAPPNFLKKGKKYVVSHVTEDKEEGLVLHFYKGKVHKIVPEDWELVEKRYEEVTTNIRNSQGLHGAKRTLDRIRSDIKEHIEQQHQTFNSYLNQITLPEKLKYVSELKGEDKILADLLFEFKDMPTFLAEWNKGRDQDH